MILEVPAGHPFFAGHFPGRPILPAVGQLALVADALGMHVRAVTRLRLRRPLGPGARVALRATEAAAGTRFTLHDADDVALVSEGLLGGGSVDGAAPLAEGLPRFEAARGLDAGPLLPHVAPARLVETLAPRGASAVTALARVPAESPFVRAGRAPAFLAIEAAAQAAAALETLRRRDAGGRAEARVGFLVGARDVKLPAAGPAAGADVVVELRLDALAPPLAVYAFEALWDAGEAAGRVSTFLPESSSAALEDGL